MFDWLSLDVARKIVSLVGILAVLLTVLLGYWGITKDYKDTQDKITRWGRYAAGAVVFSGGLSLLTMLLQDNIDAEESRQQRETQQHQFNEQLAQVRGLSTQMRELVGGITQVSTATTRLQGGMEDSLKTQSNLLSRTEKGLEMGAQLARQEQANTEWVPRRVWEDSNQVRPNDLSVSVVYQCSRERGGEFPIILPDARMGVTIDNIHAAARDEWVVLRSARHDFAPSKRPVGAGTLFQQTSHFGPLLGDLGRLRDAESWRGARVRVSITGQQDDILDPKESAARGWKTIPCKVTMMMLVGGRRAAFAEGELRQNVVDGRANINVRFPDTEVLATAIPALPATRPSP